MRLLDPPAPVATAPNRNFAFAVALFEELERAGVRHVCVCPGSRSAPLAVAVARNPRLRAWTHVDERAAGFFALGLAKTTRSPVALVCTSGSAAANFLPAVVEANHARVPLLVLTADRPPELRGCGAPQTIDQVHLYGSQVRWYAEAAPPEPRAGSLHFVRSLACRAVAEASGAMPGPVHLNLPFREPLDPCSVTGDETGGEDGLAVRGRAPHPYTKVRATRMMPDADDLNELVELARAHARGVIACGPVDLDDGAVDALVELGVATGWPILAEPTAQLRSGRHVGRGTLLARSDLFLRDASFAANHAPDVVVRVGLDADQQGVPTMDRAATACAPRGHRPGPGLGGSESASELDRAGRPGSACRSRGAAARFVTRRARRLPLARSIRCCRGGVAAGSRSRDRVRTGALGSGTAHHARGGAPRRRAALHGEQHGRARRRPVLAARRRSAARALQPRRERNRRTRVERAAAPRPHTKGRACCSPATSAFLHDVGASARRAPSRLASRRRRERRRGRDLLDAADRRAGAAVDFDSFFRVPHGLDLARIAQGSAPCRPASRTWGRCARPSAALVRTRPRPVEVPLDRARTSPRAVGSRREVAAAVRAERGRVSARDASLATTSRCTSSRRASARRVLRSTVSPVRARAWRAAAGCAPPSVVRVDMLGHGRSDAPRELAAYAIGSLRRQLVAVLDALAIRRAHLLGYSMGGRLGLALAVLHPERVASALLVGARAGIEDRGERDARIRDDERLASQLERDGLEAFVDRSGWRCRSSPRSGSRIAASARRGAPRAPRERPGRTRREPARHGCRRADAAVPAAVAGGHAGAARRGRGRSALPRHRRRPGTAAALGARRASCPRPAMRRISRTRTPSRAWRSRSWLRPTMLQHSIHHADPMEDRDEYSRLEAGQALRGHPSRAQRGGHRAHHHLPARGAQRISPAHALRADRRLHLGARGASRRASCSSPARETRRSARAATSACAATPATSATTGCRVSTRSTCSA